MFSSMSRAAGGRARPLNERQRHWPGIFIQSCRRHGAALLVSVAFVVAAPAFLWVEWHQPDPLLDLGLFRNRLFALGNLTGLLNGIARNGVLFLLVFYLQGVQTITLLSSVRLPP